ncbi:MAG: hypothetical protein JWM10_4157 [Myxococcaceae bacterium]|nr:hypothetical protein [Myxococcaceae bacterium]
MSAADDVAGRDESFVPLGRVEGPVHRRSRVEARSAHRTFRDADGFEVAIPESVVGRLLTFARDAAPREWLGLVVGQRCEDARGAHLLVLGLVPDRQARADDGRVETTHASENATRSLARTLYPDAVLLGWAHSHVRCGVTFSSTDRATQATWRAPYSLGIVVDPWDPRELTVYRGPTSEALAPVSLVGPAPPEPPCADPDSQDGPPTPPATPHPRRRGLLPLACLVALGAGLAALQRTQALAARVVVLERRATDHRRPAAGIDAGVTPPGASNPCRALAH